MFCTCQPSSLHGLCRIDLVTFLSFALVSHLVQTGLLPMIVNQLVKCLTQPDLYQIPLSQPSRENAHMHCKAQVYRPLIGSHTYIVEVGDANLLFM